MSKREYWDEWSDLLGNTYKPGDYIAVPTGVYNGGANMCIGKVVTINKTRADGKPITKQAYRMVAGKRVYGTKPWCSVTYTPLIDSRKTRWSTRKDKKVQNASTQFPENCVKVELSDLLIRLLEGPTEEEQEQELEDVIANLSRMTEELSNEHDGTRSE